MYSIPPLNFIQVFIKSRREVFHFGLSGEELTPDTNQRKKNIRLMTPLLQRTDLTFYAVTN